MSLFRKPKKQIQRRVFTENSEDEDEPAEVEQVNANIEKPLKKNEKSKVKTKQPLLSFETEEEGEVFQVKKSSHSKKIMRMFEKERQKKKEPKVEKDQKPKDKTEIITDDLILVVNERHKPPTPPAPILSGRDALCAGKNDLSSSEDEDSATIHRFSKPDNFKKVLESGAIPDAAMIHAARKRRQRAREMGDFLPVEEEKEVEDTGRLQREDEHEGSDDERIDMDLNHAMRDHERRREQFLAAQESDREIDEWEDQQIRKGAGSAAITQELIYNAEYMMHPVAQAEIRLPVMEPGVPRTPQMIAQKLKEQYENVWASREQDSKQLSKIQEDINEISTELDTLKVKAPEAADRFRFYQELRGYITDLVECLDEKIGVILSLEQKALDLLSKRSIWLVERRRQDVRDQAEEATNKYNTIKGPEDELHIRRAAEREGRRTRRRRAREITEQIKHVEGMSSDEEMPPQEIVNFDKEQEQIELEAKEVFENVISDYSTIANILIRFEQWRENDLAVYNEAYATLCLPKIVTPLIKLNLIFWNPLTDNVELEKLNWYRTLALYGLHDDETEISLARDPDLNLIPTIIEKVILPRLIQLVDKCWDPLSSSQTLRLLSLTTKYIRRFPTLGPGSKFLNNLFNAILHKMKTALEHDVFIPVSPKVAESKSQFFQRQFASGLKLLKNITSWQGVLNENTLKELALNSLLNRYLLSAIKFCMLTDAVAKVSLVNQILPRVWLQNNVAELRMFSTCIMNLHQQLDSNSPLHLEPLDTLNTILKMLR